MVSGVQDNRTPSYRGREFFLVFRLKKFYQPCKILACFIYYSSVCVKLVCFSASLAFS